MCLSDTELKMAVIKFPNTVAGKAGANAIPGPKYTIEGARITVFTGADVPPAEVAANPSEIVLTTRQLIQGADAIARAHALAIEAYVRGIVGVDAKAPADQIPATGNYSQIKFWRWNNQTIRRSDANVNALRVAIGLTPEQMDQIFVAGSGMAP
jgi:hypothetical protein